MYMASFKLQVAIPYYSAYNVPIALFIRSKCVSVRATPIKHDIKVSGVYPGIISTKKKDLFGELCFFFLLFSPTWVWKNFAFLRKTREKNFFFCREVHEVYTLWHFSHPSVIKNMLSLLLLCMQKNAFG